MATKNKLDFTEAIRRLEKKKSDLPKQLANIALNHFTDSFRKQAWDGVPWKQVQRRIPGTPSYMYPKGVDPAKHTRGILYGKERRLALAVKNSLRSVSWNAIRFGVDVPYAVYHNEGTEKLARRQFMGNSIQLNKKLTLRINTAIKSCFK